MSDRIDTTDILRFFQSAVNWVKSGGKFVPEEEAQRRAAICRECPKNHKRAMRGRCPTCFGLRAVSFMNNVLNSRKFEGLTYCEVCGCDLNVKVNFPSDIIDNHGLDYPEHCWQRPGSENAKTETSQGN
jgi:transcription elongation factor Elf1